MRNRIQRKGKRVLILVGLLSALLGGAGWNSIDSATTPDETWLQQQAQVRRELAFAAVLDVVRQHRPTAAEGWHQTLATAIVEEAYAEEVDPLLVTAIVAKESSFKSRVVSHAGAVGLMQLRPWVAEDMALRTEVEWNGRETLHAPHLNVRLGVRYYKELIERFGDQQIALTAYCFGPSRVSMQLRAGTFDGSRYARDILTHYRQLHDPRA
ncbi:MAG: transglycosylase SLT domain-containing protein [Acidobacteria bacterium]|nr:transglycosylase SLT domain-containing protein [Acidobacteriota bacterium]NIM61897.1 transglycosylase SLT domain-containing protein [Acidobacteriota bacterium]NIO60391.1 transglycosylase SLT domain-containing protein [Acidobacteriota bacterium]NIQ31463.1 transglycosylase SLT domain-containing protein [Acidobacteriota bacterium]NIQ86707.1 transglycosylase SLT domain-containing protein [Acidobacteriota bacterium]